MNAIDEPAWDGVIQATAQSKALVDATWNMDAKAVAEGMDVIHTETASLLEYNDENSLACSVFMAYYSAKAYYMPPIRELPTGKGFADIVYLPRREMNRPALLIELKWNDINCSEREPHISAAPIYSVASLLRSPGSLFNRNILLLFYGRSFLLGDQEL